MKNYAFILNYSINEVDCIDVSQKPDSLTYEEYINLLGYNTTNCEWIITDKKQVNYIDLENFKKLCPIKIDSTYYNEHNKQLQFYIGNALHCTLHYEECPTDIEIREMIEEIERQYILNN